MFSLKHSSFKRLCAALLVVLPAAAHAGDALEKARTAHSLACGVIKEEEDYSRASDHGNRAAFDLDICKAVAVAALGPGARFNVKAYPDEPAAIKALKQGEIDLIASASPTVDNTAAGLSFGPVTFYDGEGIMIPNNPAIHSPVDLAGKKICFVITSGSEAGLHAYAAHRHIEYIWYPFSEVGEMEASFFTNNCAGLAGDVTQLANTRAIDRARSGAYTILPQLIRKDPLAPASLSSDPKFAAVVHWTVETLIAAEELGVTQATVDSMRTGSDTEVQQLLGQKFGTGAKLGLDDHWGANVIKAVGNYGEIFDRDLGSRSSLRLDRGANRLWTDGGLMYALPAANQ